MCVCSTEVSIRVIKTMSAYLKTSITTNSANNNANTTANNSTSLNNNISSSASENIVSNKLEISTNSHNNNTAIINTSAGANACANTKPAEATNVAAQLSLFDQLKNSANLNNIKCGNNNNNSSDSKLTTQKNLTDWRRLADDDSSNNSASSCSSSSDSDSSSIYNAGGSARIGSNERKIIDSFQQKFVAAVLGNANSSTLKTIKKETTPITAKLDHATTCNSNCSSISVSKMHGKEFEKLPAAKALVLATIAGDKKDAEACNNILDLTLQPTAKRSMCLRAPANKAKGEIKATATATVDAITHATAAAALCKSSVNKLSGNTANSLCGSNADARGDSKLCNTTANAYNAVNQASSSERESASKNINNKSNSNGSEHNRLSHNCVSTKLTGASQQQQQKQIKFPMPTLPPPSSTVSTTAKPAVDGKNRKSNNNTTATAGSVGIVRGTKRAAGAATEADAPATSSLNSFTTPASVAPLTAHYFALSKRQKQASTATTTMNNSAHFSTGLLSDQQQKQYMENIRALLDSDKLNSVYARHQSGSDLKSVVYSALTSALCGGNSATATAASKLLAAANQAKKKRKKKRCTDRCDSSESSDR